MKVLKFYEFILEGNTPEDFIDNCLQKVKNRLVPLFSTENSPVKKMKDFENTQLLSAKESDYSINEKTLKIKFTDDQQILYILTIRIDIEDAFNMNKEKDMKVSDIKKSHITLDKYGDVDGNYSIIDRIMDRTVDPNEIDGDFLLKLKIELDSGEESKEEEFAIETSDETSDESE